ncbi:MAG: chloride channel protein, partial [Mesorhizobium sp.]
MAGISRRYPMLRRSQAMWASRRVWQPRLVFWAGAISIGLISVLFALLADRAQALFHVVTGGDSGSWRFYL